MDGKTIHQNENDTPGNPQSGDISLPVENPGKKIKKQKRKIPKKFIIIAIIVLIAGLIIFGLYKLFKPEDTQTPTAMVMRGPLETYVTGNATAMPIQKSDVVTNATGKILETFVKSGDVVNQDDLLFTVDASAFEEEVNDSYTKLIRAQDSLTTAMKRVDNLNVKAPSNGKTIDVKIKKGDYVSENMQIATMIDDRKMRLKLYFIYSYIDSIRPGMTATVSIPQSMGSVTGTVDSIEKIKKISPEGTILFSVEIVMDNPGTLTEGMLATAYISSDAGDIMPAQSGTLEYFDEISVIARSAGTVENLIMKDYYEFSTGDTLCVLSNDTLASDISLAQKDYDQAQKDYDQLMEKQSDYEARSPISGTIISCAVSPGDELSGTSFVALSVADLSAMVVDMQIDEMDIGKLKIGMPATVTMQTYDNAMSFTGEITSLAMEGKAENGVSFFPGQITVYNTEGAGLMTGMYVDYSIMTSQKDDCLTIPSAAAVYTESGVVAFVREGTVSDDQTIELPEGIVPEGFVAVPIEIGEGSDQNIEVLSGLDEGMEVALTEQQDDDNFYYGGMSSAVMVG